MDSKSKQPGNDAAFPTWAEAPVSSNLRKERVRAALFRKLEPVRIGRFILLEPLGAGAMGEIYTAYDDQLDRKVALKLVRGGAEPSAKADERLLREAQTLAQVSHPNVVQIYEAGGYNGRLFIAMELIRGKTLSHWLKDAAQVPWPVRQREILRLFIAAGRGLEAAHAAGVAHRDFKPDNVLVGDDGRVRVVDFGLARALGEHAEHVDPAAPPPSSSGPQGDAAANPALPVDPAREQTVVMSGAAAPAAPAAPADPADPAARTDPAAAFATNGSTIAHEPTAEREPAAPRTPADSSPSAPRLKAALRLTETGMVMGTPVFMAPEQMRGAIADRRSDQFSFCVALYHALYDSFPFSGRSLRELRDAMASQSVEFAPTVPVPNQVRRALLRGLSVEPSQRFPGMAELLAELEPKSRRLRSGVAVAAGLLVVALGAAVVLRSQSALDPCAAAGAVIDATWSAERQAALDSAFGHSALPLASAAWRGAKPRLDGYASQWRSAATAACQATHVAHTQSIQQLDRRMLCLDRGKQQLTALVGELASVTPGAIEHAVEAAEALPELEACSRADNLILGLAPPPAGLAGQVAAVRAQLARAATLELMGRYEEALAISRDAGVVAKRLAYPPVNAEVLAQIARVMNGQGTANGRDEAERLYFDALDIAEAERHEQLGVEIWRRLVDLAAQWDSSMDRAHAWWRRSAAAVARLGDAPVDQAKLHYELGEIYYRESKYAQAADEERRAIAAIVRVPAHQLELSRYDDALAKSLERLDSLEEAIQLHERALAIATEALGASHATIIRLKINYGQALHKAGHRDRARVILEDALASIPADRRESHADAAGIHSFLSAIDYMQGQLDHAAEHARHGLEIYLRILPPDHVRVAEAYTSLANLELRRRNFTEALAIYQRVLVAHRRRLGDDHYKVGVVEAGIAETLFELGRYGEATAHLREADRVFERNASRDRAVQGWLATVRGELLVAQRQFAAAVPELEHALERLGEGTTDPPNYARAAWYLARALHELGKNPARVRSLTEHAHASFTAQGAAESYNEHRTAEFLKQLTAPPAPRRARPRNTAIR
jgi:serine/threonine protein kinase/tetratricopeptide (TPR) repeat protein